MSDLSDRMERARRNAEAGAQPPPEAPAHRAAPVAPPVPEQGPPESFGAELRVVDPLAAFKSRAVETLFDRIGSRINDSGLTEDQLNGFVREELTRIVAEEQLTLTSAERKRLIDDIVDDALGLGPLQRLLDNPDITEIMVNTHDAIYIERDGQISLTPLAFRDEEHLRRVIERIVGRVGRRIDERSPLVDARLLDGSRVNAVIPPLAVHGSSLNIRKFSETPFEVDDLIGFGTMTPAVADLLRACVEARLNVLVSGGTGTGKTTMLNVLSSFVPSNQRIVTIEDAIELKLRQRHVVTLESRPPNIEGEGQVTIRDLVRNALRMRPDRIIVGEVRGAEALDMLQAMNTGHEGSLSTLHANSPRDAISRLETMSLMAGMDLPMRAIREQVASALDVIIQIARLRDGTRRITAITEVLGMENDTVVLQDAFSFDYAAGIDQHGRFRGSQIPTGIRPRFTERFEELGIPYDLDGLGPAVASI
ncbi:CpaF family protein [Aeromicrobium terrae]|uniref:CpaF family protein n=1 Tax=Aeromicrobium terrae TaxID=2498846 RepID=A0A5C8NM21_9ACTN|nr:CpaF family protein [Aeromicrobium terrae]TXL62130.1 CpaF family protein [Aeromicrobium terrae]